MTYEESLKQLQETLKNNNYSLSAPRKTVFGLLHNKEPQSMRELNQQASGIIDRSSLYRSIELFEMLDIIHRVHYGWKYKVELSEDYSTHHHHLTCDRCGKVVTIDAPTNLEQSLATIATTNGYMPTSHQIELHGICGSCSK